MSYPQLYRDERRRPTALNALPVWAQVVSVLGFPIVVAMILLGMLTGVVGSPITEARDMLKSHTASEYERTRLIRVMCRQTARAQKQDPDECDVGR